MMPRRVKRISIRPEGTLIFDEEGVIELLPEDMDMIVGGRMIPINEIYNMVKEIKQ